MEQANGRWWFKYSPEFKRQAVDRMTAGECVSALAKELGVGRRFLYAWPENGYGSADPQPPMRGVKRQQAEASASERPAASLKKRISELERLVGRQAAELDFFAAALRDTEGSHARAAAAIPATNLRQAAAQGPLSVEWNVPGGLRESRRFLSGLAGPPASGSGSSHA